jgi:Carboxypeptidase regulatory-like domain
MTRTFACFVAFAAVAVSARGQPGQAPHGGDASPPARTAAIRGRVLDAETGKPVRRALVRVFPMVQGGPEQQPPTVVTDDDGRYDVKGLAAGRYSVNVSKSGYVSLQYGQTRPFEPGRPIEILDAQILERVDVSLPRGGVIRGRVFDEYGDPVPDVRVQAMRSQFVQGQRRLTASGGRGFSTDDTGEFRISGLPPGQYYLSATLGGQAGAPFGPGDDERIGYAATYFPSTTNAAEAQRVAVGLAQTVGDMNIVLVQTRTARVTGMVLDSTGKPMVGMMNVSQVIAGTMTSSYALPLQPGGTFVLNNLAPGEYMLRGMTNGDPSTREIAALNITVAGQDIDDLHLVAEAPATVTGRLVLDTGSQPSVRTSQFRIGTSSVDPTALMAPGGFSGPIPVRDDFTFELKVPPGKSTIRLVGTPPGFTLKAVRLNGVDITDSGTVFKTHEDVSGVEVELTNRPANVSGTVSNGRGLASDFTVVVFSRDEQRWISPTRYILTARPDQQGRFRVPAMPAGDYYVAALDYVEPGRWTDPEFLQALRSQAVTLSITDGESKTIDLMLLTPR